MSHKRECGCTEYQQQSALILGLADSNKRKEIMVGLFVQNHLFVSPLIQILLPLDQTDSRCWIRSKSDTEVKMQHFPF